MNTTAVRRRRLIAILAGFLLIIGIATVTQAARPPAASASVSTGDVIFAETGMSGCTSNMQIVQDSGGTITNLSDCAADDQWPSVSPGGSKIAFQSLGYVNGDDEPDPSLDGLYVMNSDGSGKTQLMSDTDSACGSGGCVYMNSSWNPSGTALVFGRYFSTSGGYTYEIDKVNADGTGFTTLVSDTSSSTWIQTPAWSPDGSKIVYSSCNVDYCNLDEMNADGTDNGTLVDGSSSNSDADPVWSPDGTKIYFDNGSYIYGAHADGSDVTQITSSYGSSPTVSADGSTLAYVESDELYTVSSSADDEAGTELTSVSGNYDSPPQYVLEASPSAPNPSWWYSGTTFTQCDTAHNTGSAPLTHSGVNTTFYGVTACGGGSSVSTNFGGLSVSEYEWQCTELVTRYMYLRWGVPTYVADGYQIVSNYSGNIMTKVTNTGSNLPVVGDVISFNRVSPYNTTSGHTAIVTAVSVTGGSGTITTMEQNSSSTGIGSVTVSGGGISTTIVNGWLHHN